MRPLLQITSVPIAIEYKVTRAALRYRHSSPQVDVTRVRGDNQIQTTPSKVMVDSTETRASMGLKTSARLSRDYAESSREIAGEATRAYVEGGNHIVDSHGKGNPIVDIAMSRIMRSYETALTFIPSTPPQMSVWQGSISFNYSMDKLTFDWNITQKPVCEYVPGSVEFSITQHPFLVIEYLGGPIYAPPSADPDYEPPTEELGG